MHAQRRRNQINQRRLVADFSIAKKFRACDVAATAMGLHSLPVVGSLHHVFASFGNFQLDHCQASVTSQRQQIDWANAKHAATRGAKLRMQRRDDQTGIESRDVAAQQRFKPGFGSISIKRMVMVRGICGSMFAAVRLSRFVNSFSVFSSSKRRRVPSMPNQSRSVSHHPAHARERQTKVTQRFTMPGADNVDRFRSDSD